MAACSKTRAETCPANGICKAAKGAIRQHDRKTRSPDDRKDARPFGCGNTRFVCAPKYLLPAPQYSRFCCLKTLLCHFALRIDTFCDEVLPRKPVSRALGARRNFPWRSAGEEA